MQAERMHFMSHDRESGNLVTYGKFTGKDGKDAKHAATDCDCVILLLHLPNWTGR